LINKYTTDLKQVFSNSIVIQEHDLEFNDLVMHGIKFISSNKVVIKLIGYPLYNQNLFFQVDYIIPINANSEKTLSNILVSVNTLTFYKP